ncbi:Heat shock protein 75 kDa, mitochondrial [Labeo rohita]|uniref:Heat shock protein 75 kDa, mitochondrial n=1 Tax=Labeo rohita TaxID=84645 RepID=A0ABQ8L9T6_LABRO|nr:Heat shock protein 75 kDa, mitochondrial [Labeo rohita]
MSVRRSFQSLYSCHARVLQFADRGSAERKTKSKDSVDTNVRQQLHHTRPVRLWISSCAGVSVSHHSYSTQQTESTEEETLHSIISETENVQVRILLQTRVPGRDKETAEYCGLITVF